MVKNSKKRQSVLQLEDIRRGQVIGRRVGKQPDSEAEHFVQCSECGGWIDCRDFGNVIEHIGPLPHPVQDKPQ
jgi:hypothetical protein